MRVSQNLGGADGHEVTRLLEKIDRVEAAIDTAEAVNSLAREQLQAEMQSPRKPARSAKPPGTISTHCWILGLRDKEGTATPMGGGVQC